MKSIIPLLAIPVLAAFALVGCNQNTPVNSTDTQSTNSSVSDAGGASSGITNAPATNSLPIVDTNTPASINAPTMDTNAPAGTNQ
jgi:uncharacterized protein YcfL